MHDDCVQEVRVEGPTPKTSKVVVSEVIVEPNIDQE